MSKRRWTDEQLIVAVKNNRAIAQVARALGLKMPGSYKVITSYIKKLGLDTSHFMKDAMERTEYAKSVQEFKNYRRITCGQR